MKFLIVLTTLFAVSCASQYRAPSGHVRPIAHGGTSHQYRQQNSDGSFKFGYQEDHPSGGSFRHEHTNSYGATTGSYGLRDIDGRSRVVNYVADNSGFRAHIQTNEPGVGRQNPAAVQMKIGSSGYSSNAPAATPHSYSVAPTAYPSRGTSLPRTNFQPAPTTQIYSGNTQLLPTYDAPVATSSYGQQSGTYAPALAHLRPFSYSFGATHPTIAYSTASYVTKPVIVHSTLAAPLIAY